MTTLEAPARGRRRNRGAAAPTPGPRNAAFHRLENTLPRARAFSDDQVAAIHDTALRVLEELGIRVLLPEGRARFAAAGATVDEDSMMVRFDRAMVTEHLAKAPSSFTFRSRTGALDAPMGSNSLMFSPGGGCPNVTDRVRGRRPGDLQTFEEVTKLADGFGVIHKLSPSVEPQDVPVEFRHYATMRAQLTLSDKLPFVYARSSGQTRDTFAMIRLIHGLDEEEFAAEPRTQTVINTNSPRQLDRPMTQGIIDFAEAGQVSIITPFCLAGAMAPITMAGALTLSHAEAVAGVVLSQIVRPGVPVIYGAFCSNVDMKSGAPAFGTPEHIQANFGAGQLARHIGLPWRSAAGTASCAADAQGAGETQAALWGCLLAGANVIMHAAGWLEGGLVFGHEKFIADVETLETVAAALQSPGAGPEEIGFDAIAEVEPGGHFFAASHTMERYATAFAEPLVGTRANFGQWTEAGRPETAERATAIWQRAVAEHVPPAIDPARIDALDAFIAKRRAEGGARPMD
ncbi:MAG: trimethylamine methyltransferase family protein [Pseudomonadota bacterium]